MKATSLRYLDAKFHHPSLGASPKLKKNSQKYQRTVGYPSTSWASCFCLLCLQQYIPFNADNDYVCCCNLAL